MNEQAFKSKLVGIGDFKLMIGKIQWEQKIPVPVSNRLGVVSNNAKWTIPTENGWSVHYTDNPHHGWGVLSATSPKGTIWVQYIAYNGHYYVRNDHLNEYQRDNPATIQY